MSRSLIRGSRSKYGVRLDAEGKRARTVDGNTFASQREANRYAELLLLLKAKVITNLEIQPAFPISVLAPDGCHVKCATYFADFRYRRMSDRVDVTEDVKSAGTRTPVYRLKKKLVEAIYGIEVLET